MLRHWRITDHKLLASYPIDRVGLGGAALDGAGRILVLSGEASDLAMGQNFLSGIPPAQVLGPYDGLYLIDAETGLSLDRFPRSIDTAKNFNGAVVSLDGRKAATRSTENPGLKISFELKPAVIVYSIPANPSLPAADTFSAPAGQSDLVGDFALDAQGRLLAVFAGNDRFQLWDVESRQEWGSLELPKNRPGTQPDTQMKQVSISPTRQWLAAFGLDLTPPQSQQVTLWRLDGRRVQWQLQVNFKDLNTFAFNPAGTLLAAAADDGLHVWNTQNGAEVKSFPGPIAFGLAFSHNGSQLAWGDWTGTVHLAGLPNP
jgi:WD40 repeat protein